MRAGEVGRLVDGVGVYDVCGGSAVWQLELVVFFKTEAKMYRCGQGRCFTWL